MIAVDTNILVRHLTEDDPDQLRLVHALFRSHEEDGAIFISTIVLLELHWVLESCYRWSLDTFCEAVEDILRCPSFTVERASAVKSAVSRCRKLGEFSDALIGQIGASQGAKTYTLDRRLAGDATFVVLGESLRR